MRILIVSHRFPWPLHRGDTLTVYKMAEYFGERHEVDLLCHDPPDPKDADRIAPMVRRLVTVPFSRARACARVVGGIAGRLPFQVRWCSSAGLVQTAEALARKNDYDVVLSYYLRPAEAVRSVPASLRVVALQLSLALQWERAAKMAGDPVRRLLRGWEAGRLRAYESELFRAFDRCLVISPHDAAAMRGVDESKLVYNPHGVDHEKFRPPPEDEAGRRAGIVFTGLLSFQPNEDAVLHFVEEIFPLVKERQPDARFTVVGRDPGPRLRALDQREGIRVVGTVPRMEPYLTGARVSVDPLRIGAGLQNKVLEALSSGTPVVMSRVANEGIGAPESACFVRDEPADFAEAVVRLLEDDKLWAAKSSAARAFIENEWTWEHHFEVLEENLGEAVKEIRSGPGRSPVLSEEAG